MLKSTIRKTTRSGVPTRKNWSALLNPKATPNQTGHGYFIHFLYHLCTVIATRSRLVFHFNLFVQPNLAKFYLAAGQSFRYLVVPDDMATRFYFLLDLNTANMTRITTVTTTRQARIAAVIEDVMAWLDWVLLDCAFAECRKYSCRKRGMSIVIKQVVEKS